MPAAPYLPPEQGAAFDAKRRTIGYQRDAQSATMDYARAISQQRYARDAYKFGQQQRQARNALPASYNRRNLMNSGIWRSALQNYHKQRLLAQQEMSAGYAEQMRNYDLQRQQMLAGYAGQEADLEMQRQAALMQLALQMMGGS